MPRFSILRRTLRRISTVIVTILVGGFLCALLIRLAPGYGFDEREIDPRLRAESIRAIRAEQTQTSIVTLYFRNLQAATRGDLGVSRVLNRPTAELFAERLPVTARSMAVGLAIGWGTALGLLLAMAWTYNPTLELLAVMLSGAALALPAAVIALLFLLAGWPPGVAVAVVIFPRIFRYLRSLLLGILDQPHVLFAQAKGLGRARILAWHVLPVAAPQIAALAGVSVSLAFGALIPIEVVCGSPGFGLLAWQAAQGRDLQLLLNITVLVTIVTIAANSFSDFFLPVAGDTV
jgi:peptide/nickel transport system permease protein